ncbi:Resolvase, N terminal domain [Thermoflavimicrobium dichotomicum]|uniref:Resolvase, N terminal domain n=1 Tax=Thermoflavimicrobium dichotomicum TaxID=46223 RepID=A0A1I3U2N8_9BACL|nr:Resolvase, N terminal domain [Thermoflavimicrobium dichotomicum]
MKVFPNAKGWIVDEVIEDVGSGLNYNRKKWNQLLEEAQRQKISRIIIAHKDRFVRFGYEWFKRFLKGLGVEVVVVHNEKRSPEQELVQDLISIIHVFSSRIYGLRKYKKKLKEDQDVKSIQD